MTRKLTTILSFIPFLASCQTYTMGTTSTQQFPVVFTGKTVNFIGNSITFGLYASDDAHRWTNLFTVGEGNTQNNMGISGEVLQTGFEGSVITFNRNTIPFYDTTQASLFISLGVNDILQNTTDFTPAKYSLVMDSTITFAINSRNWPHQRIVIVTPFAFLNDSQRHIDYSDTAVAVALRRSCTSANVYTPMKNSPVHATLYNADGIHPNDAGHAFIANFLLSLTYYQR